MKIKIFSLIFLFSAWIQAASVPVLSIRDSIHVGTFEMVQRMLLEAEKAQAPAVLIEIDTPGGYLESTRDLVQLFLSTKIPVIYWIQPAGARAASAGSILALAAHFSAMASSTSIGAATPVSSAGEDITKDMKQKVQNDTVSFVRGIAEKRGRNAEWAAASITQAASLTADEAVKKNVVDGIANSRSELWQAYRKKFPTAPEQVDFEVFAPSLRENILSFISNPNVAYGLMAVGALGIYAEITHPGLIIPGAVGALSLALGAMTTKIVPIQPAAIGLLVIGLILLAIEILTPLPTFGVAGVLGGLSLLLSGIFLLDPSQTNLRLAPGIWLPAFFVTALAMGGLAYASVKALKRKSFPQGLSALIGEEATVLKVISAGEAKVQLHGGELWTAQWKNPGAGKAFIKGAKVLVVEQDSFLLRVELI